MSTPQLPPTDPARRARGYIPEGERIVMWTRPSPGWVLLRAGWPAAAWVAAGLALAWAADWLGWGVRPGVAIASAVIVAAAEVSWREIDRALRLYVLTEHRVVSVVGVVRRRVVDAPLRTVQHVTIVRGPVERLLGLGTIGFATPGTAWTEIVWASVDRPADRLETIRSLLAANQPGAAA